MTANGKRAGIACIVATLLAAADASGQNQSTGVRTYNFGLNSRLSADQQGTSSSSPLPAPSSPGEAHPVVQLTLDDVVRLTLDRNLGIAVQRLNPQISAFTLASIKTAYAPSFASILASQSLENPPTSSILGLPAGASGVTVGMQTFNGGLTQNVPWGGGTWAVSLNNTRNTSNSTTAVYTPYYLPLYSAQYTQPLLRGFSIDNNRQALLVAANSQDISETQLKATLVNTLSNVREAYWNYVYTVQAVNVAQQSLDLAEQLVKDNEVRRDVGTMADLDVVTAQSQAAQALQSLIQAEGNRRTAEIAIKQFIVSGTEDANWASTIDPVDRPEFNPQPVDVDAAIRRALSERTDLSQARENERSNDVTLKFLKNQLLPQADLVARYGLQGIGGDKYLHQTSSTTLIPGGFGSSLGSLLGANFPQWNVQLNISMPLGTSSVTAAVAQAKLQMEQTATQKRQIELQIATDITNAAINIRSATEAVQAAQAAQALAQRTYEAEQAKFEVGLSTNYNVILALNSLNAVKNSYLQAVLNYNNDLVEFDRLQQTTLQSLNVTIVTPATLVAPNPIGSAR
jgi:outer membrane protein TolC